MTTSKPHFGNLQKRAKALGLVVTRMSTDEDARYTGHHEYVLTRADATVKQRDNARLLSLYGISHEISEIENANAEPVVKDACGNVVKPSDPDYKEARDEMRGKTVPVFKPRNHEPSLRAKEALESLKAARIVSGSQVFGAMDKAYSSDAEAIKESYRHHIAQLIAFEAKSTIEFTEHERVSGTGYLAGKTDTHIVGKVVVMREEDYMKAMSIIKEIVR